jgi:hypothetical protein
MKQSMTEDADAEGEINQIVFAELVTHVVETQRGSTRCVVFKLADLCNFIASRSSERDACFSQMKHSSRCNDRSSVGAVHRYSGIGSLLFWEKKIPRFFLSFWYFCD